MEGEQVLMTLLVDSIIIPCIFGDTDNRTACTDNDQYQRYTEFLKHKNMKNV